MGRFLAEEKNREKTRGNGAWSGGGKRERDQRINGALIERRL
jgi:hypothetical protein